MVLYILLPVWLLSRGWPTRAGVAMIVAALLPWIVWLFALSEPLGPGAGIALLLTACMLLLALVPLVIGIMQTVMRAVKARRGPAA